MIREKIEALKMEVEGLGRSPVRIVFVTKNMAVAVLREAYDAGARDFGENRVQELLEKKPQLPGDIRWHFLGHLQTNKVKEVVGQAVLIHSLDSIHLAKELEKVSAKRNEVTPVLVQVNTSGEVTKFGFKPEEVEDQVAEMTRFSHLKIEGLMTIGPFTPEESPIRKCFKDLKRIQQKLKLLYPDLSWHELSMGMSDDYRIALQEGSTILRIGRAIFGERK